MQDQALDHLLSSPGTNVLSQHHHNNTLWHLLLFSCQFDHSIYFSSLNFIESSICPLLSQSLFGKSENSGKIIIFFSPLTFNYWSMISSLHPEVLVHASSRGFLSCNGSAPMLTMPQRIIIITEKLFLYIYAHQEHRFYSGLHHVMSEV